MKHTKACFRLLMMLGCCLAAWTATAESSPPTAWAHFKEHFVSQDGRVIDIYQNQISHSEGQGYAMLLAERFGDRALFDTLWTWTRNNLQARKDGLLAWSWGQRPNGQWNVIDYNNASDGDLLVAYALARASQRWKNQDYADGARRLAKALREQLAVERDGRSYLLTGYYGFADKDGLVLNPAYQIPSAHRALGGMDDKAFWEKIGQSSAALWQSACGNVAGLPADWLAIGAGGKATPAEGRPARFGYEAIRVFLYADWLEPYKAPCGADKLLEHYRHDKRLAAWYALDGKAAAPEEASAGYYAIASRLAARSGHGDEAKRLRETADKRLEGENDSYYSHILYLLALAPR